MANEIKDMMAAVATVVDSVSGIRTATSEPKEKPQEDTFAVVFMFSAKIDLAPQGSRKSLSSIAIDILRVRRDLPRDLATLNPLLDSIPLALCAEVTDTGDKFGGTISTFKDIDVQLLPAVDYGGALHIGYRFLMNGVKILVNQ